jgi:hypothetical protein
MIAFESLLERDFIYLLDYDQEVEWFEEQPLTIEYRHEGKTLHYTPDFHLLERGRDVLIECKPDRFVDQDVNRHKFVVARDWCLQRSWQFRVVTDRQVRAGFRLQNIKLLTRYARQSVSPDLRGRVYALLCDPQTQLTVDAVAKTISPDAPAVVMGGILHMAYHHEISISVNDTPISRDSFIGPPARAQEGGKS